MTAESGASVAETVDPVRATRDFDWARRIIRSGSIFIVLGLLWLGLSFASPYFFTGQNIRNIFLQSSTIGILALGVTVVLIAGEIDISIASVQALSGVVAGALIVLDGLPFWLGIAAGIGAGVLAGLVNSYMTLFARIPSFIATLAMLGIAQGVAYVITGAIEVDGFPTEYDYLGTGRVGEVPVPVLIAVGVYVAAYLLLSQTRTGVDMYAVGGSRRASRLVGLRIEKTVTLAFVISGGLAGLAGILLSARLDAAQGNFGSTDLLSAIAAVVIGGTSLFGGSGSVVGTAAGVLIITTIDDGLVLLHVETFWTQIVVGGVILMAVIIDQLAKGELKLKNLAFHAPTE